MLQHHFLALLVTFITSIFLAIFVFTKGPKKRTNITYSLYTLAVGLWSICEALWIIESDPTRANILIRIGQVGAILVPVWFVHFVLSVTSPALQLKQRWVLGAAYVYGLIFLVINVSGDAFGGASPKFYFNYFKNGSISYLIFFITWVMWVAYGLGLLVNEYLKSHAEQKKKYAYFIFPMIIAYIGGGANFLPAFDIFIPYLLPFGTYAIPIYMVITAYAIIAYGLMDIRVFIRKTFIYSLLVVSLSLVYIIFVFGTYQLVLSQTAEPPSIYLNFLALLIIATLYKPLELMIQRLVDNLFFKGSIGEISDQKEQLETELERRERLKSVGILAAGMAHEIRNPITAIKTFAEHLPDRHNDPEFRKKFCQIVVSEAGRIVATIEDLLHFSKPAEPRRERCDVHEVLRTTLDLLSNQVLQQKVKIESNFMSNNSHCIVDGSQVKQAFLNLLINALAATPSGGKILISTQNYNESLEIRIEDTGCGIPKEKLVHIFDPFYTTKQEGTGLGLAITHTLIQSNSGSIRVTSDVNHGSTFIINLPTISGTH